MLSSSAERLAHRVLYGFLAISVITLTGCVRLRVTEAPAELPGEWRGRKLYATPYAFVYATNDAAAREMQVLAGEAVETLRDAAKGAKATRGIIVCTEVGAPALTPTKEDLAIFLGSLRPYEAETGEDSRQALSEAEIEGMIASFEQEGLAPPDVLGIMPVPLDRDAFAANFEFPADSLRRIAWVVSLPTSAATEDVVDRLIDKAMEREELGTVQRIIAAPVVALVKSQVVDLYGELRLMPLVLSLIDHEPSWSPERKREVLLAYIQANRPAVPGPALPPPDMGGEMPDDGSPEIPAEPAD